MSVSDLLMLNGEVEEWRGVGRSDLCPAVPVEATLSHIRTRRVEAGVCGAGGWGD